ncbi:MAG: hypothetical protein IPQ07_16310 [Myxococcales bacterium]|nr:hypothetical protein [Myxococcales bacterium]
MSCSARSGAGAAGGTVIEDLDLDSLDAIDLAVKVEETTGLAFDEAKIRELKTIEDVIIAIGGMVGSGAWPPYARPRRHDPSDDARRSLRDHGGAERARDRRPGRWIRERACDEACGASAASLRREVCSGEACFRDLPVPAAKPAPGSPAPAVAQRGAAIDPVLALLKLDRFACKFTEEKHVALLARPLKSTGTIYFERDKGIARTTLTPKLAQVVLTRTTLRIRKDNKTEEIPLDKSKDLKAFALIFPTLLRGDRAGAREGVRPRARGRCEQRVGADVHAEGRVARQAREDRRGARQREPGRLAPRARGER